MKSMKSIIFILCIVLMARPAEASDKLTFSSIKGSLLSVISERVLQEAFGQMGIEITLEPFPAKRALIHANDGKTDGELHRVPGIETKYPNLIMVQVPINRVEGIVYTKNVGFRVNGWQSIKPYCVGVRRGIIYSDKGTQGMDRLFTNSYEELFEILESERVDVIVLTRENGLDLGKRLSLPAIKALEPPVEILPLHVYLHKKNKHLIPQLTMILQKMEKEGKIKKIRELYLEELSR